QPEVAAVQDPGAAELLDEIDDLDCVLAAVVTLPARVPLVRIWIVGLDTRDDVVPAGEVLLAITLSGERIALLNRLGVGGRVVFPHLGLVVPTRLVLDLLGAAAAAGGPVPFSQLSLLLARFQDQF